MLVSPKIFYKLPKGVGLGYSYTPDNDVPSCTAVNSWPHAWHEAGVCLPSGRKACLHVGYNIHELMASVVAVNNHYYILLLCSKCVLF